MRPRFAAAWIDEIEEFFLEERRKRKITAEASLEGGKRREKKKAKKAGRQGIGDGGWAWASDQDRGCVDGRYSGWR